eukprot:637004-Amphidinium_carterae.1
MTTYDCKQRGEQQCEVNPRCEWRRWQGDLATQVIIYSSMSRRMRSSCRELIASKSLHPNTTSSDRGGGARCPNLGYPQQER